MGQKRSLLGGRSRPWGGPWKRKPYRRKMDSKIVYSSGEERNERTLAGPAGSSLTDAQQMTKRGGGGARALFICGFSREKIKKKRRSPSAREVPCRGAIPTKERR